jgi:cupin fold WbuC family metalloprotein
LQFIEGKAVAIIFEDNGTIKKAFTVSCYDTNNSFYYSMSSAQYHMLIIQSDILIFKETVRGPFIRDDTVFPDWAPNGDDRDETNKYLSELMEEVNSILS